MKRQNRTKHSHSLCLYHQLTRNQIDQRYGFHQSLLEIDILSFQ